MHEKRRFIPLDAVTARRPQRPRKLLSAGFTLIELLVVIAIIALLMSILMPAVNLAKQQAKAAICKSNLHQWGLIMQMYTGNNNGYFMPDLGHQKYAALGKPELKEYYENDKLLLCPMAKKTYEEGARNPFGAWRGDEPADPLGNLPCSYGINSWILSVPTSSGQVDRLMWKTPNVRGAINIPMILDCAGYENATPWHHDEPPEYDGHWVQGTSKHEMRYACLNRHSRHVNAVFCDFTVRKIGLKQLWELKWHRKWYCGLGDVPDYDPPIWPDWMKNMKDYAF